MILILFVLTLNFCAFVTVNVNFWRARLLIIFHPSLASVCAPLHYSCSGVIKSIIYLALYNRTQFGARASTFYFLRGFTFGFYCLMGNKGFFDETGSLKSAPDIESLTNCWVAGPCGKVCVQSVQQKSLQYHQRCESLGFGLLLPLWEVGSLFY